VSEKWVNKENKRNHYYSPLFRFAFWSRTGFQFVQQTRNKRHDISDFSLCEIFTSWQTLISKIRRNSHAHSPHQSHDRIIRRSRCANGRASWLAVSEHVTTHIRQT